MFLNKLSQKKVCGVCLLCGCRWFILSRRCGAAVAAASWVAAARVTVWRRRRAVRSPGRRKRTPTLRSRPERRARPQRLDGRRPCRIIESHDRGQWSPETCTLLCVGEVTALSHADWLSHEPVPPRQLTRGMLRTIAPMPRPARGGTPLPQASDRGWPGNRAPLMGVRAHALSP